MLIGVIKETFPFETRVAATPETAADFTAKGIGLLIESGAGTAAGFADAAYKQAGAVVLPSAADVLRQADILLKIRAPVKEEIGLMKPNSLLVGDMQNLTEPNIKELSAANILCFGLEKLPRISRAQPFDILSSQNNLAGYQAVIKSLSFSKQAVPLMITSAGTVPPLNFLIIGVGVAGLQAIATAKRLGGRVFASDPRQEVMEQVKSLGASFTDSAVELLPRSDIIITSAFTNGKQAPRIITKPMLKKLPSGAVLIDMAAAYGGNVEGSEDRKTVMISDTVIYGDSSLACEIPMTASRLFANNLYNFVISSYSAEQKTFVPDFNDPLIKSVHLAKG